MLGRLGGSSTI
ncbi:unnamed protein product [Linum tenue]|uniref:Uncharacterized protein n=1 Tax=Linum tenue TaxID=586396 RepID=A0AAV0KFK9_9ROSI|nr:unnamed protein product [Linum tenue]